MSTYQRIQYAMWASKGIQYETNALNIQYASSIQNELVEILLVSLLFPFIHLSQSYSPAIVFSFFYAMSSLTHNLNLL
jgi:hypothetical protein